MSEVKTEKFTPGPWYGDGREKETGDILVYAPEGKHGLRDICFIPEDDGEDVANARLIAATPELYEALVEARIALAADVEEAESRDGGSPFLEVFRDRLAMVDAALAKARGDQ